jgi:hypothetical protein
LLIERTDNFIPILARCVFRYLNFSQKMQTLCHAIKKIIHVILQTYNCLSSPVIKVCEAGRQKIGN